ncbi:MAG: sigma 54-interacting transcriptional regulator [Negativicutes bacterium]|nr:sigma 54-interacting transcriptional regulator [Negativicutes bacterium]
MYPGTTVIKRVAGLAREVCQVNTQGDFESIRFLKELLAVLTEDSSFSKDREKLANGLQAVLTELQQAEKLDYKEILDGLYDGIIVTDEVGKALYVNKAYTRITGISPEEVLGQYISDISNQGLLKNPVAPEILRVKKQVNSMGEALKTGKKVLITGNPIFDEQGNVKKIVIIDREISDLLSIRADLEASLEKMKAVEKDISKEKQEIQHLRKLQLTKQMIGFSSEIQEVSKMIQQVANLDTTVLIVGETGSGKEVVANAIYSIGKRNNNPFIKVNCAAIPAALLESELFGYDRGAFTGASSSGKLGLFELADGGTILLDEIGEMPIDLQSKFLRVIQNKEVTRIGGSRPVSLDVRILAATNRDLRGLVREGKFREDLYYRLNVFPITIPPLRSRVDDIEEIANHFLELYNAKYGRYAVIEHQSMEVFKHYSWPGNVRELQNVIERLVIISDHDALISVEQVANLLNVDPYYTDLVNKETGLKEIMDNLERRTIQKALALSGSTRKAAQILKIDQSNVVRKAQKLGIDLKGM